MKIEFQNNEEDAIVRLRYILEQQAAYQKTRSYRLIFKPLIPFIVLNCLAISQFQQHHFKLAYAFIGTAFLLAIFMVFSTLRSYRKHPEKIVRARSKEEVESRLIMEISPEGISAKDEKSATSIAWNGISKIIDLPDYLFIFASSNSALVVPRRELGDAQFQAFKGEIARYKPLTSPLAKDGG